MTVTVQRSVVYFTMLPAPRSTLFPTRRSSDLSSSRAAPRATPPIRDPRAHEQREQRRQPADEEQRPPPPLGEHEGIAQRGKRSEEHTSELQSRRDLVCRLLLEKNLRHDSNRATICCIFHDAASSSIYTLSYTTLFRSLQLSCRASRHTSDS